MYEICGLPCDANDVDCLNPRSNHRFQEIGNTRRRQVAVSEPRLLGYLQKLQLYFYYINLSSRLSSKHKGTDAGFYDKAVQRMTYRNAKWL